MKLKHNFILFSLILTGMLFTSCSSKYSLQKRKYTKGYYFNENHSSNNLPSNNEICSTHYRSKIDEVKKRPETSKLILLAQVENKKQYILVENKNSNNYPKKLLNKKDKIIQSLKNTRTNFTINKKNNNEYETNNASKIPLGFFGDGSVWGIIGLIFGLISVITTLIYLLILFAILGSSGLPVGFLLIIIGIILLVGIIGLLFAFKSE